MATLPGSEGRASEVGGADARDWQGAAWGPWPIAERHTGAHGGRRWWVKQGEVATMKISYGAVVPLPPDEAFAFVSEPTTWPTFFESMRSVEKGDDWGAVGGHARMTKRIPGPVDHHRS